MVACSYGVAFGAIQQLPQIVPGLDTVKAKVAAATEGKPDPQAKAIAGSTTADHRGQLHEGARNRRPLVGRFALAMLVVHIASRRRLLRTFLVPGLIVVPLVFWALRPGPRNRLRAAGAWAGCPGSTT